MELEHEIRPVDESGPSASVSDESEINIPKSAEQSEEKLADEVSDISEINISEAIDSGESGGNDNTGRNEETATGSDSEDMAPPPEQAMEGYDPLRIPLSVFETSKSAAPTDWSVASNESLFSIHVGSSSFSADPAALAGEVSRSEDPGLEEDSDRLSLEDGSRLSARVPKPTLLSLSSSHSLLSEESDNSALSFAFPILPGSMCYNESVKQESDCIKREKSLPTKTLKPSSQTNQWFWCFSCTTCLPWCSWPRNCCPCNYPRHFCCFYC